MKLYSGKRRGFSKSVPEVQVDGSSVVVFECRYISLDLYISVCVAGGCTSPVLHTTNRWHQTAGIGEVRTLCSSPTLWTLKPAGN